MAMNPPNPSRRPLPGGRQGGIYSGGKYGYLKADRRKEAAERQAVRDGLTPQQQIDRLDRKLGKDKGAAKERARLAVKIKQAG